MFPLSTYAMMGEELLQHKAIDEWEAGASDCDR